ncbi:tautomerase family protein [Chloroflexus aggregans]|uniref:4-oxalocrotonate tautomerase family enzyme n=1 Tax=Chloroflexus aggregans (strain MD-66 / DSM 9485) TaxID=326427 RepID=B8GBV7_CHLAD|nr:tautomerase family protein [Chloroflexus aggregans]ACL24924.1 4-oxalocrotonate tautomerase family enzyme [Chloroflexus aggregans DSM 9485]
MMLLRITMLEGRSPEQKAALARELSIAAAEAFHVPLAEVRLVIHEVPPAHWTVGGQSMAELRRNEAAGSGQ